MISCHSAREDTSFYLRANRKYPSTAIPPSPATAKNGKDIAARKTISNTGRRIMGTDLTPTLLNTLDTVSITPLEIEVRTTRNMVLLRDAYWAPNPSPERPLTNTRNSCPAYVYSNTQAGMSTRCEVTPSSYIWMLLFGYSTLRMSIWCRSVCDYTRDIAVVSYTSKGSIKSTSFPSGSLSIDWLNATESSNGLLQTAA